MRELWRRIIEWLRRLRRRPGYAVRVPNDEPWERLEHFNPRAITGDRGTRSDVLPDPEPERTTTLRDTRGAASR